MSENIETKEQQEKTDAPETTKKEAAKQVGKTSKPASTKPSSSESKPAGKAKAFVKKREDGSIYITN